MNRIFGNSMFMSEKSLDFLWKKQTVTMNNLANVDTPGYKAQYVTFEEMFQSQLKAASTSGKSENVADAIHNALYQVHNTATESARLDGNNVNTDSENVELTRAALQYQYVLSSINSDINRLRTVIKAQ